jgi:hypothetical protein
MEHRLATYLLALTALVLGGCAALAGLGGSATTATSGVGGTASFVPNSSWFDFVGRSTKIRYLGPAALLSGSNLVAGYLIEEQCAFDTADPPFLVPTVEAQKGWTFAGRLNQEQTLQALEYKSILTLGLWGNQQLNTWPVNMILLSDFPERYLDDRLAMLAAAKLPPAEQKALADEYIADARKIRSTVQTAIRAYDSGECAR